MATPNIVSVATINGFTVNGAVTTSDTDIVTAAADYIYKISSIIICNIDGTNAADITVGVSVDNGSTYFSIASTISVPADAAVTIVGKDNGFYLDETDLLKVTASANSDLTYCVSYDLMKDA